MVRHKIVFQSNFTRLNTGFAKNLRAVMKYLYKTGKYDIIEYSAGLQWSNPDLKKLPWKAYGTLPDDVREIEALNRDPHRARDASYGGYNIDRLIREEKPTIWFGIEDPWAFSGYWNRKWWNKINCVIHTTLDAVPPYQEIAENANKINHFYVWSEFAERAMHKLGHMGVKTLHGTFESEKFFKISAEEKRALRRKFNIPEDAFVIIDVFRNQLRKTVYTTLEAYASWKRDNPQIKNTRLLFVTSTQEGWDILKMAKEYGVPQNEVLFVYVCKNCGDFEICAHKGHDVNCRFCGAEKAENVINVSKGITEDQLRQCYGVSDLFVHPFKNGGQELPIQEAKLCELITAVTNYSCGEDMNVEGAASLPLDYVIVREFGTQFINAQTSPQSLKKQMHKVYNMSPADRAAWGRKAREWVLNHYSVEVIGKKIEELIDSMPIPEWDYDFSEKQKNETYPFPQHIQNNGEFIVDLYKNILLMNETVDGEGYKHWMSVLQNGSPREKVYEYFIHVARQENAKNKSVDFGQILDNNGRKRALICMKESGGDIFLTTALFESFAETFPEYDLYFACDPKFFNILEGNPYIHKLLPYMPQMENEMAMRFYFDYYCFPAIATQRQLNYLARDKTALSLS